MKIKLLDYYMNIAIMTAQMSYSEKLKVGCIIVNDERIVSYSWNGTPSGWDNKCELKLWMPEGSSHLDHVYPLVEYSDYDSEAIIGRYKLGTKPEVIHAESNAISKLARSNESGKDAVMFCTHSPCLECAKLIYQSGIKELYYREAFNRTEGLDFLRKTYVEVGQI